MADYSFEFEGLDELIRDFDKCVSDYPKESERFVYREAGNFTKDVNEKMPASYHRGTIPKSWKRHREKSAFTALTASIEIENVAPHWHLVENGHELIIPPERYAAMQSGQTTYKKQRHKGKSRSKGNRGMVHMGFVPGKKFCEMTRQEWNVKYPDSVSKFVDKMLKGHNL